MSKIRVTNNFRDVFQLLAVIGGIIVVSIALGDSIITSAEKNYLLLIGGGTALADAWFLWKT